MTDTIFEQLARADPVAAGEVLQQFRKTLFVPHSGGQREVMECEARFRVLRAGRRWGKTKLAAREAIMAALSKPNQMVWWVANSDKNVRRGYRNVLAQLPRMLLTHDPPSERANDRILTLRNGSQIEFYTSGTPDALAGEGVNFMVVDEAALIEENVWFQLLRPTLSDTRGRALIVSTPRGRNWFHTLWNRGQEGRPDWASWHHTSYQNPYVDDEEVDDARDTMPDLIFRQEYLAEFVANAASMFAPPETAFVGLAEPRGWVVLGVDLAKKEDFTVLSGCNADTRQPCWLERFNEISWPVQQDMIVSAVQEIESMRGVEGVTVVIDSGGVGDVVFDDLEDSEAGLDVVPINFGSGFTKERMVRLLAADLEHGRAFITEEERDEFEAYEYNITKSGRYQFEASIGHDDYVAAKMLQNWGCVHEAPPGILVYDPVTDPLDEELEGVLQDLEPDSPEDIMANPAAWSSYGA